MKIEWNASVFVWISGAGDTRPVELLDQSYTWDQDITRKKTNSSVSFSKTFTDVTKAGAECVDLYVRARSLGHKCSISIDVRD